MRLAFQKRHILEHNGGLVDEKYLENSGDRTYNAGQRLIIRKPDILRVLEIIRKLGTGIQGL